MNIITGDTLVIKRGWSSPYAGHRVVVGRFTTASCKEFVPKCEQDVANPHVIPVEQVLCNLSTGEGVPPAPVATDTGYKFKEHLAVKFVTLVSHETKYGNIAGAKLLSGKPYYAISVGQSIYHDIPEANITPLGDVAQTTKASKKSAKKDKTGAYQVGDRVVLTLFGKGCKSVHGSISFVLDCTDGSWLYDVLSDDGETYTCVEDYELKREG